MKRIVGIALVLIIAMVAWGQPNNGAPVYIQVQNDIVTLGTSSTSAQYKDVYFHSFHKPRAYDNIGYLSCFVSKLDTNTADTIKITEIYLKGYFSNGILFKPVVSGTVKDSVGIILSGTSYIYGGGASGTPVGLAIADMFNSNTVFPCDSLWYSITASKTSTSTRSMVFSWWLK